MKNKPGNKTIRLGLRATRVEKNNISKLARFWRVSESEAIRLAVLQSLQSAEAPHIPLRLRRPIEPRRKVTG